MDKPRCAQPLQATPDAFLQSSDTKGCNQQLDKASLQEIFDSADVAVDGELDIVSEENRSPEHAGSPVTVEETRLRARCMALQALAEDLRTEALQLRGHALVDCSTEELYHLAKTLEKASKRVAHGNWKPPFHFDQTEFPLLGRFPRGYWGAGQLWSPLPWCTDSPWLDVTISS